MCVYGGVAGGEAKRLRRAGGMIAACSASLSMAPALSMTHGHPVFAMTLIGVQAGLLSVAIGLLARSRRVAAREGERDEPEL